MSKKNYNWKEGAVLEEHTKKKHEILRAYFREYLVTRCKLPLQEKFRLAIVDGFSGAGLYKCGSYGSPLIFIEVLIEATNEINLNRVDQGMRPIQIECFLVLNDSIKEVVDQLRQNISPLMIQAKDTCSNLRIETQYFNAPFEEVYPEIKQRLQLAKCRNVMFNLDQCGYSQVTSSIIRDIISSWSSAEVILTFMIGSMLTYLSPAKTSGNVPLEPEIEDRIRALLGSGNSIGKKEWLGEAELVTFAHLKGCAPFVSPFSINNPGGWRYWLMHFASSYRAREVYNNLLHRDEATQAHFGRSGLHMLSYDPQTEGRLYLFDDDSRESAKVELYDDIPRLVAESGDTLGMGDFYRAAYSETPAHSDDIHEMIIDNPDIEVITESGGERRKPNTIKPTDTLRLKNQRSMFFMFSGEVEDKK
jgi:three-Cys-motif partner protein